jgi:hypothetical protein
VLALEKTGHVRLELHAIVCAPEQYKFVFVEPIGRARLGWTAICHA